MLRKIQLNGKLNIYLYIRIVWQNYMCSIVFVTNSSTWLQCKENNLNWFSKFNYLLLARLLVGMAINENIFWESNHVQFNSYIFMFFIEFVCFPHHLGIWIKCILLGILYFANVFERENSFSFFSVYFNYSFTNPI